MKNHLLHQDLILTGSLCFLLGVVVTLWVLGLMRAFKKIEQ